MARLALGSDAEIGLSVSYWSTLADRIAATYFDGLGLTARFLGGLHAGVNPLTNEAILLIHPLWDQNPANYRPEVSAAMARLEAEGLTPRLRSLLRAVRFPYE